MSTNESNNESIAQKQQRLQELLAWFDGDEFQIEQVSQKFAEASAISDQIEKLLMDQKNTITVLKEKFSTEN